VRPPSCPPIETARSEGAARHEAPRQTTPTADARVVHVTRKGGRRNRARRIDAGHRPLQREQGSPEGTAMPGSRAMSLASAHRPIGTAASMSSGQPFRGPRLPGGPHPIPRRPSSHAHLPGIEGHARPPISLEPAPRIQATAPHPAALRIRGRPRPSIPLASSPRVPVLGFEGRGRPSITTASIRRRSGGEIEGHERPRILSPPCPRPRPSGIEGRDRPRLPVPRRPGVARLSPGCLEPAIRGQRAPPRPLLSHGLPCRE
jgi:hypothetical protein